MGDSVKLVVEEKEDGSVEIKVIDRIDDEVVGTVSVAHDGEDLQIDVARNDESVVGSAKVNVY